MGALESDIEKQVVADAQVKFGVISLKLNVAGNTGWPDRLFFIPGGSPLFVEFKQKGAKPRAKQRVVHDYLKRLGYHVETYDDADECLKAITKLVEAHSLWASQKPKRGKYKQRIGPT